MTVLAIGFLAFAVIAIIGGISAAVAFQNLMCDMAAESYRDSQQSR